VRVVAETASELAVAPSMAARVGMVRFTL